MVSHICAPVSQRAGGTSAVTQAGREGCYLMRLLEECVLTFSGRFKRGAQLLSGLRRIGGSIPIVFSYYSEFLAQEKRGEHLSWLCMFWMIGGIYASAMAWAIIPHYGEYRQLWLVLCRKRWLALAC